MSKFKLPSGAASIEAVVGLNTEKDYTTPLSKKNISKALMESLYINLEQQQEIAELKAMVDALRGRAEIVVNTGGFIASLFGLETALKSTPAQCLASVKADAITDAANHAYAAGYKRPIEFLHEFADKLREKK